MVHWLVTFPDRDPLETWHGSRLTRAEVLGEYPIAIDAEPITDAPETPAQGKEPSGRGAHGRGRAWLIVRRGGGDRGDHGVAWEDQADMLAGLRGSFPAQVLRATSTAIIEKFSGRPRGLHLHR
jgi:hypothetical protein